LNLIIKFYIF